MREREKGTVYDVIGAATDEGEWVNIEFEAVVRNAVAKQGKKPASATLHDPDSPNIKIVAKNFGGDFFAFEGKRCLFGGQGMKVKTYKGAPELTLSEKSTINALGAAAGPAPAPQSAPSSGGGTPRNAAQAPQGDPAVHFHKEMKKVALLMIHAQQYAWEVESKLPFALTEDQRQSLVSSLFITGKDRGLLERPPAPRDWKLDDKGEPVGVAPFVLAAPKEDPELAKRLEEERKKAAEEAARKAHEEEQRRQREQNLDEDVPF